MLRIPVLHVSFNIAYDIKCIYKLYKQSFKDSSSASFLLMKRQLNKKFGKGPYISQFQQKPTTESLIEFF